MRIFISQSGAKSYALAKELQLFVRRQVSDADPWMSDTGIAKGTRWGPELAESLAVSGAGLICLTPDNLKEPWILFEAGALSRSPKDRVWTFLLDVTDDQLGPQLAQFQNTKATKDDVLEMIKEMNRTVAAAPKQDNDVEHVFGLMWPAFEARINEIRAMPAVAAPAPREPNEVMSEVLASVRDIGRQLGQGANDSWRISKTMGLVRELYREVTGRPAPSMAQLAAIQQAERDGVAISIPVGGVSATGLAAHLAASSGVTEPPLVLRESAAAGEAPPASDARAK